MSSDQQCVGDVAERLISISVLQDTQQSNAAEIFDIANVVADPGVRRPIDEYGTPEYTCFFA